MYIIGKPHVVTLSCLEMVEKYICAVHSKSKLTPKGTVYLSKIDYTVLIQF